MKSYRFFPIVVSLCVALLFAEETHSETPAPHHAEGSSPTPLTRGDPSLASNASLSALAAGGSSTFSLRYECLDEPQLRVLRFEPRGIEAVRVIRAYENYYSPYKKKLEYADLSSSSYMDVDGHAQMTLARQPLASRLLAHRVSLVPTELLHPVETRHFPLPTGDQELTLSLREDRLYPQQRTGLYLIELSGEEDSATCEKDSWNLAHDAVAASQSVIQHSDLGLIWKMDDLGKQLFVYGFHLSTGEKIQQPHLSLYSHDAQLLHEQPISPEGSRLSLSDLLAERASQLGYLQISCGQDAYTVRLKPIESAEYGDKFDAGYLALRQQQALTPRLLHYCFTDRPIYRPGETAHVKGYLRRIVGNTISLIPDDELSEIEVQIQRSGLLLATQRIDVQADNSFSLDVPIEPDAQDLSDYTLEFRPIAAAEQPHLNESFSHELKIEHFRRSRFVFQSASHLSADGQTLRITAHAQPLTGDTIPDGYVSAKVYASDRPFAPAGWSDYSFGDQRYDTSEMHSHEVGQRLDATGKAELTMARPQSRPLSHQGIFSIITVSSSDGGELTQSIELSHHPAELYLGLRPSETISHVSDSPMMIDILVVDTEGKPSPAPSPISVRIEHDSLNVQKKQPQPPSIQSLSLDAQGRGRFPLSIEQAGLYTITAEGEDALGQPYRSVITHRVDAKRGNKLDIKTDKKHYQANDTVRLRLGNRIEGELLITLERDGVLRHLHRRVRAHESFVEIPLLPDDAPSLTISALHIRGAEETASGIPQIISGSSYITIEPRSKQLDVTIKTVQPPARSDTYSELSGQVRDAEGRAMPHAILTLYVVDEGSLEAGGYSTPAPHTHFWRTQIEGVYSSSTLGQLLQSGDAATWTQGVLENSSDMPLFMMGGSGGSVSFTGSHDRSLPPLLEENPQPCLLWLPHLRTDAEGRYKVQLPHPSTGARYRVIAIATHGTDQFGISTATYHKPFKMPRAEK